MTRNEALQIVSEVIKTMDLDEFDDEQRVKIDDALEVVAAMRKVKDLGVKILWW